MSPRLPINFTVHPYGDRFKIKGGRDNLVDEIMTWEELFALASHIEMRLRVLAKRNLARANMRALGFRYVGIDGEKRSADIEELTISPLGTISRRTAQAVVGQIERSLKARKVQADVD